MVCIDYLLRDYLSSSRASFWTYKKLADSNLSHQLNFNLFHWLGETLRIVRPSPLVSVVRSVMMANIIDTILHRSEYLTS